LVEWVRIHAWGVDAESSGNTFDGRPVCRAAIGSRSLRVPVAPQAKHFLWAVKRRSGNAPKKLGKGLGRLDFRLGFVTIPGRKNVEYSRRWSETRRNPGQWGDERAMNTTDRANRNVGTTGNTLGKSARQAGGRGTTAALTRRQREIYDFISQFVEVQGYSPSLEEIAGAFGLSSVATVHKHVKHLVDKGYLRKAWNRSRSVEPIPAEDSAPSIELPILGSVAAGSPIEAIEPDSGTAETYSVPADMVPRSKDHYVLRVRGDSMIEDQICDGDLVVIEGRQEARNGETVVALVDGAEATLKRFYRDGADVKLVPANHTMSPMLFHASQVEIRGVVRGLIRSF